MSNDSELFYTRDHLEADGWNLDGNIFRKGLHTMLPLYESKMIHHYDHRWATFADVGDVRDVTDAERRDPSFVVLPRYWVTEVEVANRLSEKWRHEWLLGFRSITKPANERTLITAIIPCAGVGNSMPLMVTGSTPWLLAASLSSIAIDYALRQKMGGTNLNFFYLEQVPVPIPSTFATVCPWSPGTIRAWIEPRILELFYTSWDMKPFADTLGHGGAPFTWSPERRSVLRAELDAAFFHLYRIDRDDAEHILSTFPIANRKDPELSKRVLDAYDRIGKASGSGEPFVSSLDPPPGHGPCHPDRP